MTVIDFNQRPILDLSSLCVPIPELPPDICYTFPGGLELCIRTGPINMGLMEYARWAMGLANASIAPLGPIFQIIDMIMSILDTLSAVPDVVSNPSKLVQKLKVLADKAVQFAKLLPWVSLPLLVVQLLETVIVTLEGLSQELQAFARFSQRISDAQFAVGQAPGLEGLLKCARSSQAVQMANLERVFASVNTIIVLINAIGKIAQIKKGFPIPSFEASLPPTPILAAQAVENLVYQLRELRRAIPILDGLKLEQDKVV